MATVALGKWWRGEGERCGRTAATERSYASRPASPPHIHIVPHCSEKRIIVVALSLTRPDIAIAGASQPWLAKAVAELEGAGESMMCGLVQNWLLVISPTSFPSAWPQQWTKIEETQPLLDSGWRPTARIGNERRRTHAMPFSRPSLPANLTHEPTRTRDDTHCLQRGREIDVSVQLSPAQNMRACTRTPCRCGAGRGRSRQRRKEGIGRGKEGRR